jgi:hypothetical protein
MWLDFSPRRAESIDLPGGKDLSDAVGAGADLKSWIMSTCTDLGIDLRQLPGLIWEQPLGTIRGRLLEPGLCFPDPCDDQERAAELVNPLVIGGESGMDIPERGAE